MKIVAGIARAPEPTGSAFFARDRSAYASAADGIGSEQILVFAHGTAGPAPTSSVGQSGMLTMFDSFIAKTR